MKNKLKSGAWWRIITLVVIVLIINLPIVSALEISNVVASDVTDSSAIITWATDEEADSFVYYGTDQENLVLLESETDSVAEHNVGLSGLAPLQEYLYYVTSNGESNDNEGSYYSFTTLEVEEFDEVEDVEEPEEVLEEEEETGEEVIEEDEETSEDSGVFTLTIDIPEIVAGDQIDVNGTTLADTELRLYVNEGYFAKKTADDSGLFEFNDIQLVEDSTNVISVEATSPEGETTSYSASVYSDDTHPEITFSGYNEIVEENDFVLKGTVSEEVTIEIFVNEKSAFTGEGTSFESNLNLEEGVNTVIVEAVDAAGWKANPELIIESDTEPPEVESVFEKGEEYYQNRATTNINGTTEPGSNVYLFIYRPLTYKYEPDFSEAYAVVTADDNGEFMFEDINFETDPISWQDFSPELVPSGLEGVSIYPEESVEQAQEWVYNVYIIAEDKTDKTGYEHKTVTVHTCYSENFDFQITDMAKFQSPLRLRPDSIEVGREEITAVFELDYRGSGSAQHNIATGAEERAAFSISSVNFEKACTQSMIERDTMFSLACSIMPRSPTDIQKSSDGTVYYVKWQLASTEGLNEVNGTFWEEFQKRQLVFPLKITVNYQEYDSQGKPSDSKTQTSCYDLGYFVDIPLESEKMIPDWLAEDAVVGLNKTIEAIDTILPYLEKVILVTGVTCFASVGIKTIIRFMRIASSKIEPITSKAKEEEKWCPSGADQASLYIENTRNNWAELLEERTDVINIPEGYDLEENFLEEKCPQTAGMWKAETALDQAYRWTCDRFLCREVPARWTETIEEEQQLLSIEAEQKGCSITGGCVALKMHEDCSGYVQRIGTNGFMLDPEYQGENLIGPCWEATGGQENVGNTIVPSSLYVVADEEKQPHRDTTGVIKLERIGGLNQPYDSGDLWVYEEVRGSNNFCAARDTKCDTLCKNRDGYRAVQDGFKIESNGDVVTDGLEIVDGSGQKFPYDLTGATGDKGTVHQYSDNYFYNEYGRRVTSDGEHYLTREGTETDNSEEAYVSQNADYLIEHYGLGDTGEETEDADEEPTNVVGAAVATFISSAVTGSESGLDAGVFEVSAAGPCYKEVDDQLVNPSGDSVKEDREAAGFTSDCFVGDSGVRYQCICEKDPEPKPLMDGVRTATFKYEDTAEKYSYRQARLYLENSGKYGTYYPEWRYYDGRDMSGAFGMNYLPDYPLPNDKRKTTVNPTTQHISAFQTLCLTGIRARLVMLRSILDGLRKCLIEAKYTGFADAGMCKTIFAQHVCGLLYKLIASLSNQCTPMGFKDLEDDEGKFGDFGEIVKAGSESIYESMDSSILDLQNDYNNAELDNYLAGGVQGVAESMCLAAFGFDWPIGFDFIQDVAYSVPMKTSVLAFPANREVTGYNPSTITATIDYDVGAVIFPGCRISSYNTYLKCIGPEEANKKGVKCDLDHPCDCINLGTTPSESERVQQLDGGRGSNIASGSMVELPIEAPQKFDNPYRYDHVVMEVYLDHNENQESCFDQEHHYGDNGGIFYFPIRDFSAPGVFSCQVESTSGKYTCPEFSDLFYSDGLAYFQDPYIMCYNKYAGDYSDCSTPNMILEGDAIRFKTYYFTDGGQYCLRVKASGQGVNYQETHLIPEGVAGQNMPSFDVGVVSSSMFGGSSASLTKKSGSNDHCPSSINAENSVTEVNNGEVIFDYDSNCDPSGNKYELTATSMLGINELSSEYQLVNGVLQDSSGNKCLTTGQIDNVVFEVQGMEFKGVLGSATNSDQTACIYETRSGYESSSSTNSRSVHVNVDLLLPDSMGGCTQANTLVPAAPALGQPSASATITLQREHETEAITSDIYTYFEDEKYSKVQDLAIIKIDSNEGYLEEAIGIYYYVMATIAKYYDEGIGGNVGWKAANLKPFFDIFFQRTSSIGEPLNGFVEDDVNTAEFQKVRKYLCEVAEEYGYEFTSSAKYDCDFSSGSDGSSDEVLKVSLCGYEEDHDYFNSGYPTDGWSSYSCKDSGTNCLGWETYVDSGKTDKWETYGCPGSQECCE